MSAANSVTQSGAVRAVLAGLKLAPRVARRDWRSGELKLLMIALVVAVAAVTSVGFFVDRMRTALERDAAQLLGADLVLIDSRPADAALLDVTRTRALRTAESAQFPSMALAQGRSQLTALKAVTSGYPLRGALRVTSVPGGPEETAQDIPSPGTVWVDTALLDALGVAPGDAITLGDRSLRIERLIAFEPDRGFSFVNLSPRVLMRMDDLATTGLVQPGSRITYRLLVAGSAPEVASFQTWLGQQPERTPRLETLEEGRPQVRATLDRAERFLALVALLSAMLAAIAVALAARRFTMRHLDSSAVMRCFGMSQNALVGLYLGEFLIIGSLGALAGCVLGFAGHFVLVQMLAGLLTESLPAPSVIPAIQGFLAGLVLLLGFALPPVLQLRRVPPLRVLRRDLGLPQAWTRLGYGAGLLAFGALLLWSSRDLRIGGLTAAGFLGAFLVFGLATWACLKLLGFLRHGRRVGASWRFALAAVQRRPAATIVQTVALALGLMALLLLSVTRNELIGAWRSATPEDAPNRFVINIQPDQRAAFAERLNSGGIRGYDLSPMVRGRLIEINGRAIQPEDYAEDRPRGLVAREFNLSYMDSMPAHNQVSAGRWTNARDEVSVEEGIARTLGLKLGDTLTFDIAGSNVTARIGSLRRLEWESMRVNFFVIFSTAALVDMPQTLIGAMHVPPELESVANALVQTWPNITVIDTGAILDQVQRILDQVIAAVEFLFLFTLGAGVLVLYAALLSSRDERMREAGLLRALGASSAQLERAQWFEFGLLGLLAGLLAAAGAVAVGWGLSVFAFEFPYTFSFLPWALGGGGGVIISLLGGWLGLRPVLRQPPLISLREV